MPVNIRTHGHGQGYADLNFMIPELISTLHYSKGPYFPDLGDFDTAGAVQINYVDTLPHDLAVGTAGTLGYYRGLGAMPRPAGAGNLLAAAEYVHANGPWTIPDNYNKGNLVLNYSQGNANNGFSFTGMYMNDAFHATNQIPQRAVTEGLICLYCPFDPTDGGSRSATASRPNTPRRRTPGYRILPQRRPRLSQQRFTRHLDECRRAGDRIQFHAGQPHCRAAGQDAAIDQGDRLRSRRALEALA
jgi:hypothetical protein